MIEDGIEIEVIDRPRCLQYFTETYPDVASSSFACDNLTVLVSEDLPPYGVGLFEDDAIAISCHERDTGAVKMLLEARQPAAWEWATSHFNTCRVDARPIEVDPAQI